MSLIAVQHIRKMPGGAQSQLMLCSDNNLWVVKFKNNPQNPHVVANELIVTRIAESVGLSVPRCDIVEVGDDLISETAEMWLEKGHGERERCAPGASFGSQLVDTPTPGCVLDRLSTAAIRDVVNLSEFVGALILDVWTCNTDFRQAVFQRTEVGRKYQAFFIDNGHCLNLGKWKADDRLLRGHYRQHGVYENLRDWSIFQPWLDRVRLFDPAILWKLVSQVPAEWGFGNQGDLESLVEELSDRGRRIDALVSAFVKARPWLFR